VCTYYLTKYKILICWSVSKTRACEHYTPIKQDNVSSENDLWTTVYNTSLMLKCTISTQGSLNHWLLPINYHFDDCKAWLVRFPCKTHYIRIPGFSFIALTTWSPSTPTPAYQFVEHTLFMTRSPPNRLTNSSGVATVKSLLWPLESVRWWPYLAMWCPDMDLGAIKQQHTTPLKHLLLHTQTKGMPMHTGKLPDTNIHTYIHTYIKKIYKVPKNGH